MLFRSIPAFAPVEEQQGYGPPPVARASGGRVVTAEELMSRMDKASKKHVKETKPLLNLHDNTVAVTSMSNLGFHRAMREAGITVVTTDVGDRAVLSAMGEGNLSLGGEQSGHIIFSRHATTGDGLLAGLVLLDLVQRSGETLHALATNVMQSVPQILRNVRVARMPKNLDELLGDELRSERAALSDEGRILEIGRAHV